ncbi:iron complex outermembrane recepter protein [Sphingobium sp. AP50]|uniref:TonB-dependent receptor plug domain-containing protein n=1 Tax=Sphingobium sp. AP50 TaxID=1884369 RepID=UPI0008AD8BE0|nr:TonB-dependent receptor [Sphingobium sp. AP50]SEJ91370.1 iron complex outermembrane recepter protein [Sphingobium sp. AP50]
MIPRSNILSVSVSRATLAVAAVMTCSVSCIAMAQDATPQPDDQPIEEIVVTGTSIRGVAPVGSQLVQLNEEQIRATGAQSTSSLLATIPQLNSFSSVPVNTAGGSNPTTAPSLRGLPSSATLSLVNGHRLVGVGTIGTVADPSAIPFAALSRVEVLTDGASSTYGSDAVAGVLNFILRRDLDGIDATANYAFADGYDQKTASVVAGKTWEGGSLLFGVQYTENNALLGDERDFVTNDFRPFGGVDARSQNNNPPTVNVAGQPYAWNGTGFTTGPSLYDNTDDTDIIPKSKRWSGIANFHHRVTDDVDLFIDANYGHIETDLRAQQVTPSAFTITSSNPFFRSPVAGSTSETVLYSFRNELGRFRHDYQKVEYFGVSGGADINLTDNWHARVFANWGYSDTKVRQEGINETALSAAAAGTTTSTAFDPFTGQTSAATLASIFDYINNPGSKQELYQVVGTVDGKLFTLPGGDLRVALGAEIRGETYDGINLVGRASAPTVITAQADRTVKSAYGEIFVPIFGDDNATTGLRRLVLTASLRHDSYNDFGSSTNPKVGAEWEPVEGLTFRGNFSKSFHAPSLADLQAVDSRAQTFTGYSPNFFTPVSPVQQYNVVYLAGGNPNLQAEKATTYSLGADLKPAALPGFRASVTYFNIKYKNLITIASGAFTNSALSQFYVLNPTDTQIASAIGSMRVEGTLYAPGTTNVLIDLRRNNLGAQNVSGLDFQMNYDKRLGSVEGRIGINGSYYLNNETQAAPGGVFVDNLKLANPRWRLRGNLGAQAGPFNGNLFINYIGPYNNPSATPVQRVKGWTTVDATLNYELVKLGRADSGIELQLSAINLFDRDPPQLISSNGLTVQNQPTYASPLGRLLQLGVRVKY